MTRRLPSRRGAFSLIELIIVVVIIAIVGAIALPRMSSAAERAAANSVEYDQSAMQRAIDLYREEHGGVLPHVGAANKKEFALRLIAKTTEDGTVTASGYLGPYLHALPTNKVNGLATLRMNGAAAGANTHGWRYNTATGIIEPDHSGNGYTVEIAPKVSGEVDLNDVKNAFDGG